MAKKTDMGKIQDILIRLKAEHDFRAITREMGNTKAMSGAWTAWHGNVVGSVLSNRFRKNLY